MTARRLGTIGVVLLLLGDVPGCGSGGPDSTYKDIISVKQQATAVFETIKDEASADSALPKLEKITDQYAELSRKMKAFNLSPDASEQLIDKYWKQEGEAGDELARAATVAKKRAPQHAERINTILGKFGMAQTTIPKP